MATMGTKKYVSINTSRKAAGSDAREGADYSRSPPLCNCMDALQLLAARSMLGSIALTPQRISK